VNVETRTFLLCSLSPLALLISASAHADTVFDQSIVFPTYQSFASSGPFGPSPLTFSVSGNSAYTRCHVTKYESSTDYDAELAGPIDHYSGSYTLPSGMKADNIIFFLTLSGTINANGYYNYGSTVNTDVNNLRAA